MQVNKRVDDITEVFNKTWEVNHNNDIKKEIEKEKDFIDKMFNVKKPNKEDNNFKPLSQQEQLESRQKNMDSMNTFNNQTKLNDIKRNFNQ